MATLAPGESGGYQDPGWRNGPGIIDPGYMDRIAECAAGAFLDALLADAGVEICDMRPNVVDEAIAALDGVVTLAQLRLAQLHQRRQALQQR